MKPKKFHIANHIEQYFPETVSEYVMTYVMHARNYWLQIPTDQKFIILPYGTNYESHIMQAACYTSTIFTQTKKHLIFVTLNNTTNITQYTDLASKTFWGRKWKKSPLQYPANREKNSYRVKQYNHIEEQLPFVRVLSNIQHISCIQFPQNIDLQTCIQHIGNWHQNPDNQVIILSQVPNSNNHAIDQLREYTQQAHTISV